MAYLSLSERISSIKAGLMGALGMGSAALFIEILHSTLEQLAWGDRLLPHPSLAQSMATVSFALISGFLFGVTYRYILRDDPNPHLKTGAIAAFGLIRGLAQINTEFLNHGNLGVGALLAGESMVMVAIASKALDWAIEQHWIEQFPRHPAQKQ